MSLCRSEVYFQSSLCAPIKRIASHCVCVAISMLVIVACNARMDALVIMILLGQSISSDVVEEMTIQMVSDWSTVVTGITTAQA